METQPQAHVDRTQKSLAMLAIMRRIEEKRKKRPRRRTTEGDSRATPEFANAPGAVEELSTSGY